MRQRFCRTSLGCAECPSPCSASMPTDVSTVAVARGEWNRMTPRQRLEAASWDDSAPSTVDLGLGAAADPPPSSFVPSGQTQAGGGSSGSPGATFDWGSLATTAGSVLVSKYQADSVAAAAKAQARAAQEEMRAMVRASRARATSAPGVSVPAVIALSAAGLIVAVLLTRRR